MLREERLSLDSYPYRWFFERAIDVSLVILAYLFLIAGIVCAIFYQHGTSGLTIGLGMLASTIAAILDYRQKSHFESNHIERSILAGEISARFLNAIARFRHKAVCGTTIIAVGGLWVSGYSAILDCP